MLYIGYLTFNIRLSLEVGQNHAKRKRKTFPGRALKEECLKPQSLPMHNFLLFVEREQDSGALF